MSQPENGLTATALFTGLSPEALEEVRRAAITRKTPKGGFLFYQGDPAEAVFVLTEGRAKLTQVTPDGQQVVLRVVGPWEIIAVIAMVSGRRYPVSAEAIEDLTALAWPRETITRLSERFPLIALNGVKVMTESVQDFQNRYREMVTERVERRIARAVLRLAQQLGRKTEEGVLIDIPLTRQDLAEMTGTTLYTVSRVLSQWEAQGLVESGRERIVVKFPHGLVRIAEDLPGPPSKADTP